MFCHKCGYELEDFMEFCPKCGTAAAYGNNETKTEEMEIKKNAGNFSKGFTVASIVSTLFLMFLWIGEQDTEILVICSFIALITGIIAVVESVRIKQTNIFAYLSIICAIICLVIQNN